MILIKILNWMFMQFVYYIRTWSIDLDKYEETDENNLDFCWEHRLWKKNGQ